MMRSVPICETEVKRLVFKYFRSFWTKTEGAAAVVRAKSVKWQRKPESMRSCFLLSGLANLRRRILEDRSYMFDTRSETKLAESS